MDAADPLTMSLASRSHDPKLNTYVSLSALHGVPIATLWRRAQGRPSRRDQAIKQQYLNPQEEKALLN